MTAPTSGPICYTARVLSFVLVFATMIAAHPPVEKPRAAVLGCKKQIAVRRALAEQLELVPAKQLAAVVRREHIDAETHEGAAAIAEAFHLDLLARCTKGQRGRLELVDADGTVLARRPLKGSVKKRQLFLAWLGAGVRDAIPAPALEVAASPEVAEVTPEISETEAPAEAQPVEIAQAEPVAAQPVEAHAVQQLETSARVETFVEPPHDASDSSDSRGSMGSIGSIDSIDSIDSSELRDRPVALLLAGGALRAETPGAELTIRARASEASSLEAELTTGVDRDREYRFLFSSAYLFDVFGASIGPSVAVGIDPGAPLDRRVARAGAVLSVPIAGDALALRVEGGYRPVLSRGLDAIVAHGYAGRGSIEGTLGGGFSYALRAEYSAALDTRALAYAALVGWRF